MHPFYLYVLRSLYCSSYSFTVEIYSVEQLVDLSRPLAIQRSVRRVRDVFAETPFVYQQTNPQSTSLRRKGPICN